MNRGAKGLAAGVAAVLALLAFCLVGLPILTVMITQSAAQACAGVPVGVAPGEDWQDWDGRQVANASVIVSVGKTKQVPA